MSKDLLKERWLKPEDIRCEWLKVLEGNIAAVSGIEINPSTSRLFGTLPDGRGDYRGIAIDQAVIGDAKIFDIDLSMANICRVRIEYSVLSGILFDKATFESSSERGNVFKDCTFKNCKFLASGIGNNGTQYINCVFVNCKFQKTTFVRAEFVDVVFENCNFKGIDFNASSFENCRFTGKLTDVWFRGGFPSKSENDYWGTPKKNRMLNVSFKDAILNDATFTDDCDLSTIVMPQTGRYVLIKDWNVVLAHLNNAKDNWDAHYKKEAEIFIKVYATYANTQQWGLLNAEDIERMYGMAAVKILDCISSVA